MWAVQGLLGSPAFPGCAAISHFFGVAVPQYIRWCWRAGVSGAVLYFNAMHGKRGDVEFLEVTLYTECNTAYLYSYAIGHRQHQRKPCKMRLGGLLVD